jgi:hypothetical protein
MNNVYRSAQKVPVWLGKGDDNGDSAMNGIEGINQELALILQNNTPESIAFIDNWLGKVLSAQPIFQRQTIRYGMLLATFTHRHGLSNSGSSRRWY